MPNELVEFADGQAARNNLSRSQVIGLILAQAKALEEEQLATEEYQFYAQESTEFAEASTRLIAEVLESDS